MSRARRIASLVAATCALAGTVPAVTAQAQAPAQPQVTVEADAPRMGAGALAAGADGALWSLTGSTVDRRASDGRFASVALPVAPGTAVTARTGLQQLAAGGMAAVVAYERRGTGIGGGTRVEDVAVVRVAADGRMHRVRLPQSARRASAFAIEPDGTVWWARACEDELYRRDVAGRVRLLRLRRIGCGSLSGAELASAVATDPNGATWLVNACQGRLVHVGADGRRSERRFRAAECWESEWHEDPIVGEMLVDPRGGMLFRSGGPYPLGGRVGRDGRLDVAAEWLDLGTFAPDGSLWRTSGELVRPDGTRVSLAPSQKIVPARGGGAWTIATEGRSDYSERYPVNWKVNPSLGLVTDDLARTAWPLTPLVAAPEQRVAIGDAVVGPDGAFWFGVNGKLVRALPQGLAAPRASRATAVRALARTGRTVTLQLACAADLGRWCTGSVRLRGADRPERFAIAGGWRGAVRVSLGDAEARRLRRGRAVRTTATVRSTGAGETRRALRLTP